LFRFVCFLDELLLLIKGQGIHQAQTPAESQVPPPVSHRAPAHALLRVGAAHDGIVAGDDEHVGQVLQQRHDADAELFVFGLMCCGGGGWFPPFLMV
jgi:hypothetical protein